ncbi:MAG: methylmalonyl-CoA mutase, partial [Psychroserpens sp.]
MNTPRYQLKNKIRIVTAASLFDGHDAAINIMRRILQSSGAEVIHLGHDRSVEEVVNTAIQEDANAIAMTSYQGGHNEYFKYMYDLLKERGCEHIRIVGGGGGVILPDEIKMLQDYGITRIYSPDDGRALGLLGMIDDMLERCDFKTGVNVKKDDVANLKKDVPLQDKKQAIARLISAAENAPVENKSNLDKIRKIAAVSKTPVLGITGTGGAGKSSLVDELIRRFLMASSHSKIAIVSVDPSKRKTGGALLGDRIRMNAVNNDRVYMRSLATRQSNLALSVYVHDTLDILKATDFDLIILETSGIGQSDTEIEEHSDVSLYVMTPEYGAATQLEKIDMLDFADIIALNKFDKRGALDALRDVKKQYKRNRGMFEAGDDEVPVYGTIASQFNDRGMTELYNAVITALNTKVGLVVGDILSTEGTLANKSSVIPGNRIRYLSEISESNRGYDSWVEKQATVAQKLYGIHQAIETAKETDTEVSADLVTQLAALYAHVELDLDPKNKVLLEQWAAKIQRYKDPEFKFKVRDKELSIATHSKSLSGSDIPKISMPKYQGWGDILKWNLQENVPGEFPYTAGLFPFKREGEDPTRMFAGEGGPERTNRRFHYVSKGMPAKRLSTAFDSVTLYGNDPAIRPDIYGKIGNAGVSICCLDDAKKLYSGFDLAHAMTSVSMTINGPAPMLLGFFLNTAIDQQCERFITENGLEKEVAATIAKIYKDKGCERPSYQGELPDGNDGLGLMLLGVTGDQVLPLEVYQAIKAKTLTQVRGTVQADILKEDQAQNTCIFSTEFALRLMGDVQE